MTTTFLISEAKLREFTDIDNNVDTALIKNGIREAQDIELQRLTGTLLYNKLLSDVDSSSLTGAYETLVNDYVQDFLIYAAYYYILDSIYLRSRNNGLLIPDGGSESSAVDRTLYNVKRQSVKNKMEYYAEGLKDYLIEEEASFPELTQNTKLYQSSPDYTDQYGSPFVFRRNGYAEEAERRGMRIFDRRYRQYPPN